MMKTADLPRVRDMILSDLDGVVELHRHCFSSSISIFSALSRDILKCFYAQMLEEPESFAAVLEEPDSGRIVGLVTGTFKPGFQGRFIRCHFFGFCWNIFKVLFVSAAVRRLLWMRLRKKTDLPLREYNSVLADAGVPPPKGPEALLMLIGVHAQWRGRGNAGRLVDYFNTRLFGAGMARVRTSIRPDNRASLRMFEHIGWNIKKISAKQVSAWIDQLDLNS